MTAVSLKSLLAAHRRQPGIARIVENVAWIDAAAASQRQDVTAEAGASQSYADYLAAVQRGRQTPAAVIASAVRAVTGAEPTTTTRIIAGEVNEVYDITTERGDAVIVRIASELGPLLHKERWAIEIARRVGVPVPDVLSTETILVDGVPVTIAIQRKLTGVPLDRTLARSGHEDERLVRQVVVAAGSILSRIHSVPTAGFGQTDAAGQGMCQTRADVLRRRIELRREACRAVVRQYGLDEAVVERAIEQVERHALAVSRVEPRLVHGDFGPKHIFVDGDRITGIIDWGEARSDDPVDDFAWWSFWHRAAAPLAWLIEGYEEKSLFDSTFELRRRVSELCLGLRCLEYYDGKGYRPGVQFSMENLSETLSRIG